MDDLDAFVKDEQAVADFREKIRDWERPWQTWNDNPTETDVRRLVALLADRERQLAEARQERDGWKDADMISRGQRDAAEAKLRAVAEWARVNDRILDDCMIGRALDAILGGTT